MITTVKNFIKENWFKVAVLILLIIFILLVSYYYLVYIPDLNSKKEFSDYIDKISLETKRNNCMATAELNYNSTWNATCKSEGKSDSCSLFLSQSDQLNQVLKNDKELCLKLYPVVN